MGDNRINTSYSSDLRQAFSSTAWIRHFFLSLLHFVAFTFLWFALLGIPLAMIHALIEQHQWMLMVPRQIESWPSIFTAWLLHNDKTHLQNNVILTSIQMGATTCLFWPIDISSQVKPISEFVHWKIAARRRDVLLSFGLILFSLAGLGIFYQSVSWLAQNQSIIDSNGNKIPGFHLGFSGVTYEIMGILLTIFSQIMNRNTLTDWRVWPAILAALIASIEITNNCSTSSWKGAIAEPNGSFVNHEGHLIGLALGLTIGLTLMRCSWFRSKLLPNPNILLSRSPDVNSEMDISNNRHE
jgi:Rhomboid family